MNLREGNIVLTADDIRSKLLNEYMDYLEKLDSGDLRFLDKENCFTLHQAKVLKKERENYYGQ